ncbi:MAG: C25 family cysteine peptidase [Candidatus Thorarchaeota archaeon]
MKKVKLKLNEISLKVAAITIATMILISSMVMMGLNIITVPENNPESSFVNQPFQSRPCNVNSILAQGGEWISFDSTPAGTPAETHVTISDTSGITIVADSHGFWRGNKTIDGSEYDTLDMPGATSTNEPGTPMLPLLVKYVEIPHNVDISIQVLGSSSDTTSGYNIEPCPRQDIPFAFGEWNLNGSSSSNSTLYFENVYSVDNFYPGHISKIEGGNNTTPMVMRGHRLLEICFYPVQYNHINSTLLVYSQIIVKIKYSIPGQIKPIAERLQSEPFERLLAKTIVNYGDCILQYLPKLGIASKFPGFDYFGAEYLIVTTQEFKLQADRLADWKERKGVKSEVIVVSKNSRTQVKQEITDAYNEWYPAPTYVLLLGDVEYIPANYDMDLEGDIGGYPMLQDISEDNGNIASDLGYFNIDGQGHIPDMIYGRISVDTPEQARVIVNKILQYEQTPPFEPIFYNSILSSGYFEDRNRLWPPSLRNGREDGLFPFIYTLEKIRHYLEDIHGYAVHVNYSAAWEHYSQYLRPYLMFHEPLDRSSASQIINSLFVYNSLPSDYVFHSGYDLPHYYDTAKGNLTPNIREGRFLVLYFGHGDTKNMIYPVDWDIPLDGILTRNDRGLVEGWHQPNFNASWVSELGNGNMTPLFVNVACNTGWFDGETDEDYLALDLLVNVPPDNNPTNPFEDYANECFAENITRIENGGAIAAISSSRPTYAQISAHLMNGIVQAFWPRYLSSLNQPIYEMGTALLYAKLYAARQWPEDSLRRQQATFEEYHLFGDPETQLWTDVPSNLDVSYPTSIGTNGPQRFVVTVRNQGVGTPVNYAKVCVQDSEGEYHVGYTDHRGQVIFEVLPSVTSTYLNITITKHNYIPHIGFIRIYESDAKIKVVPTYGAPDDKVEIAISGFPDGKSVWVFFDEVLVATFGAEIRETIVKVPEGTIGHLNVWAVVPYCRLLHRMWNPVAVECFTRISSDAGPDPYIYSQDDRSTWDVTGGERIWDNPDILVSWNSANGVYHIDVNVHNRGNAITENTDVNLFYAPIGAGNFWTWIDDKEVSGGTGTAHFTMDPLTFSVCLKAVLSYQGYENPLDEINNIGYENVELIEMHSPGSGTFNIRNPSDTEYIRIIVRQLGNDDEVWNASIRDYSSQAIGSGSNEIVTLYVDSLYDLEIGDGRAFKVEIYIGCTCIGGLILNATKLESPTYIIDPVTATIIGGIASIAIIITLALFFRRKRNT